MARPDPNTALDPNAALVGQALQWHQAGNLAAAEALYLQVLAQSPDHADALHLSGCLAAEQGRADEAIILVSRAVARNPQAYSYHYNLANLLAKQGRLDQAISHYRAAIRLKPDYAQACNNLGLALSKQGDGAGAKACFEQAIRLRPDYADPCYNLGLELKATGEMDRAIAAYREAIRIRPDYAQAHYNLGNTLHMQGRLEQACASLRQALLIKPDYAYALSNLGNVLKDQGRLEEAIASYRRALSIKPDDTEAHSNLLLSLQYISTATPTEVFAEHQRYGQLLEAPFRNARQPHGNSRDPERRLKVGYVSGDFRKHAVAYFIEPILASHDKSQVEVYGYYNNAAHDFHTERIAACVDHWLDCKAMSDEQLAGRIHADGIDILVDLSGHTAHNRLPLFARKPAPVQATWIGYPGTSGLSAMDYRFTDDSMDPPGLTERYHSETLVRLPGTGSAYRPEPGCPSVNALPALASGELVFASLNNLTKVNPLVVNLWARILAALPHARLMLGNVTEEAIAQRLVEMFGKAGIAAGRLLLRPRLSIADYLALHQQIDVALDPFPYNGGTTTMHSLWMGVPVITLAGEHTVSRCGVSLLSRVGLSQFITHSEEEYFQCAMQLANDLPGLDQIRQSLRERMGTAGNEAQSITRHLETAYRAMWRKWCAE